ncbi:hypothetical protein GA076_24035 [Vibrio parahaemolyticus]|nr:hypothetical protein [Vibrio parahaemolyticus]
MKNSHCCCCSYSYREINKLLNGEIKLGVNIEDVILHKAQRLYLPMKVNNQFHDDSDLTLHETLSLIGNKTGVYTFWVVQDQCITHNQYKLRLVYVGKAGSDAGVSARIKSQLKRGEDFDDNFFISFYECKNRTAKFIEQLVLDSYFVPYNREENPRHDPYMHMYINCETAHEGTCSDKLALLHAYKNMNNPKFNDDSY